MRAARWVRTYRSLGRADRSLLWRSAAWLAVFRALLWTRPFAEVRRRADAWGGRHVDASVAPARVAWAVETAARAVPRATCLTQALAAEVMLRRAGERPVLRFGVARARADLEAHAWLELRGRALVGDRALERYTPLEGDG